MTIAETIAAASFAFLNATAERAGSRRVADLAYGEHPRHRLDVYVPTPRTRPAPVVIFFYGGSWQTGAKEDYRFVGRALAARGIMAVIPDYRLSPEVGFPSFIQDGARAAAWAIERLARHGGDVGRVFLAGHSAGAHIALLLGLDRKYLAEAGFPLTALAGAIGISGPYDFLPIKRPDIQRVFATAGDLQTTQPIHFVDAAAPPTLLLHGEGDVTVEPRNSRALAAALTAVGATATLKTYPAVGHIATATALHPLFRSRAPVLDDLAGFVAGG